MQLRSGFAVALALADSCSSDSTPSLGTSICSGSGPRKGEKTKKRKKQVLVRIVLVGNARPFLLQGIKQL